MILIMNSFRPKIATQSKHKNLKQESLRAIFMPVFCIKQVIPH